MHALFTLLAEKPVLCMHSTLGFALAYVFCQSVHTEHLRKTLVERQKDVKDTYRFHHGRRRRPAPLTLSACSMEPPSTR